MLGRLASVIAKQLLSGQHLVSGVEGAHCAAARRGSAGTAAGGEAAACTWLLQAAV